MWSLILDDTLQCRRIVFILQKDDFMLIEEFIKASYKGVSVYKPRGVFLLWFLKFETNLLHINIMG